jgi:excinuclease ABC subunit B
MSKGTVKFFNDAKGYGFITEDGSQEDPRTKAGAFGEKIRGPHKPTLDEMGPHAERGLPVDGPRPAKPTRTIDVPSRTEKKARRHGRPRKTGRPGQ